MDRCWRFAERDRDRTDKRRDYRYRHHHLSTEVLREPEGGGNPAEEAAVREFLGRHHELLEQYAGAQGRKEHRLRGEILYALERGSFICERERTLLSKYTPRDWARLREGVVALA